MKRRTALTALAAAVAAPTATRAAWAQEPAPSPEQAAREPVPVTMETLPVVGGALEPVRALLPAAPFAMVGLTWAGQQPDVMELRVRQGLGWSDWFAPPVAHDTSEGLAATEPVWTGLSQELEIRALTGGAPAEGVSAVLVDPGRSSLDLLPPPLDDLLPPFGRRAGFAAISREGWGADESIRCSDPSYDDEVLAVALHHSAAGNDYRPEDSARIVRGIYAYHARTLGWCDVGYHALVDKYGQVFEGRAGGLDRPVIGAHAGGFNSRTSSICMLGSYSGTAPGPAQRDALVRFFDWKLDVHGLDPHGEATLVSRGGGTSRHPSGTSVRLPVIFGHRDVGQTACPGDDGYALLSEIRNAVAVTPSLS